MKKLRLDIELTNRGLVASRSQAESYIKLGKVFVDNKQITKPGFFVDELTLIKINQKEQYVSRAGLKLASIANIFKLDFKDKVVLDVGSSTGGFTDYALRYGAKKVFAVDVGTNQLHHSLLGNPKIELHEQTNTLDVLLRGNQSINNRNMPNTKCVVLNTPPNIVLIDVSFVSLKDILPHIATLCSKNTQIIAMVKPQFEAGNKLKNKGVIKNDSIRRDILKDFECWVKAYFAIINKADSEIAGSKGNRERFYLLRLLKK